MKFDLFQLHDAKEDISPRSWIKIGGENLIERVKIILTETIDKGYSVGIIARTISKKLNVSEITIGRQLWEIRNRGWNGRKNYIPIILLEEMIKLWNYNELEEEKSRIVDLIDTLVTNSSRSYAIKAVKKLSIDLCKIAGAHAADGTLARSRSAKNSHMYLWRITDGDKRSMDILKIWIKNVFGIDVHVNKSKYDNSFIIEIKNKAIFRYLNKMIGFKIGDKTATVSMPQVINDSDLENKKSFALGVMTFDGCVDAYGYIRLGIKSQKLRDEIVELMRDDDMDVRIPKGRENEFLLRVNTVGCKNLLEYFAEGSLQWLRASFFINNSGSERILELFGGNINNKITLEDVLETSNKLNIFGINDIQMHLNVSKRTLRAYLKILDKAKMVRIDKGTYRTVYSKVE